MADFIRFDKTLEPIIPGLNTSLFTKRMMTGDLTISGRCMSGDKALQSDLMLVIRETGKIIAQTSTNETGEYTFSGLSPLFEYDVIAYDQKNVWEGKVSSKRQAG